MYHTIPDIEGLHGPYEGLLRAALALATPAGARRALDVGCGPGLKAGWLAGRLAPGGLLLGVDIDRGALAAAAARRPGGWLAGDGINLPLAGQCADLAWCVCALELLGDQRRALAEIRRVLRPGGALVIANATQRWARLRAWPAAVAAACSERDLPPPADGLGDELGAALGAAGFSDVSLRAYLLEPSGLAPVDAALPLAGWAELAPRLGGRLSDAELAACAAAEDRAEPEPRALLIVAVAR